MFLGGLSPESTGNLNDDGWTELRVDRLDITRSVAEVGFAPLVRDLLAAERRSPSLAGLFTGDFQKDYCRG